MFAAARIAGAFDSGGTLGAVPHASVLPRETLEALRPAAGGVFVDATVGAGGHAEAILEASAPDGRVIGIDRDPTAVTVASRRLARFAERFVALHGDYRSIVEILRAEGIFAVDGIVADLGVSSMQLDDASRGFSFRNDGPLDMRLDPASGERTAAELLATWSEDSLRRVLRDYGEERLAGPIARAVVRARAATPLVSTRQLAEIVLRVAGPAARKWRIHPATRTFQAIRIAVNRELEGLDAFVHDAVSVLRRGARLAVISFHSLEDRAVKRALRELAERCICPPGLPVCGCGRENLVRLLSRSAVVPSADETRSNPRARSAKLRAAERL